MVRMHPRWHAVRELIRDGRLGALRAFQGTFAYALSGRTDVRYEASMGGGVLYDTGFYPVTMSRFCFEAEPVAVLARAALSGPDGVDVLSSALLEFPGGQATLTCGMELTAMQRALLVGTTGHLDVPAAWPPAADRPSELTLETSPVLERPQPERRTFEAVDQYALLVAAFARAVAERGPGPIPLEDSVKNVAVLEALVRSSKSGRWEIPEA
jgi:predicted dehydrogenase